MKASFWSFGDFATTARSPSFRPTTKPDLTCRAVTLIMPERHQWSMVSQWEWTAAAGSTFATACLVSGMWEIVDVRPVPGEGAGDLSGWKLDDADPARPVLNLFFRNALRPDRPQRVRILSRRLPPGVRRTGGCPPAGRPPTPLWWNKCWWSQAAATFARSSKGPTGSTGSRSRSWRRRSETLIFSSPGCRTPVPGRSFSGRKARWRAGGLRVEIVPDPRDKATVPSALNSEPTAHRYAPRRVGRASAGAAAPVSLELTAQNLWVADGV